MEEQPKPEAHELPRAVDPEIQKALDQAQALADELGKVCIELLGKEPRLANNAQLLYRLEIMECNLTAMGMALTQIAIGSPLSELGYIKVRQHALSAKTKELRLLTLTVGNTPPPPKSRIQVPPGRR